MASAPANRPHSFDIPRAEDDLAEWASRIKAMQRQVDEDDQAEQRKLEEEIAKSRMKRLRRSQMYASRPGTPDLGMCTPLLWRAARCVMLKPAPQPRPRLRSPSLHRRIPPQSHRQTGGKRKKMLCRNSRGPRQTLLERPPRPKLRPCPWPRLLAVLLQDPASTSL
jgi:hypothetical protein